MINGSKLQNIVMHILRPYISIKRVVTFYSLPSIITRKTAIDVLIERALESSAIFIENHGSNAMIFKSRSDFWDFAISSANSDLIFAEFGVSRGKSISHFAKRVSIDKIIYGFDSFLGIKENFTGTNFSVGAFSTNGKLPKVPANVKLIEGWFEDSLPKFLRNIKGDFGFIHLDADTYDSTKFVLNSIGTRITKGSIIIFDEYIGVPNWQSHEHRAWKEFVAETGITFQYIAFAPQGAMVRVI